MNRFHSVSPKTTNEGATHSRLGSLNSPEQSTCRAEDGSINYVWDINLFDFKIDKVKVHTKQNVLYVTVDHGKFVNGIYIPEAHLFRRINLPTDVDNRTISCNSRPNGILTVSCKRLKRSFPQDRQQLSNYDYVQPNSPSRTDYMAENFGTPESRHVKFLESDRPPPGIQTDVNAKLPPRPKPSEHNIRVLRSPPPPKQQHKVLSNEDIYKVIPLKIFRKGAVSPSLHTNVVRTQAPLFMPIELRPELTAKDIRITSDGFVVHIAAEKFWPYYDSRGVLMHNRQSFRHKSEHTLPTNVNTSSLTANLCNGIIYLKASYILPCRKICTCLHVMF